jgi:hypothetical protein
VEVVDDGTLFLDEKLVAVLRKDLYDLRPPLIAGTALSAG